MLLVTDSISRDIFGMQLGGEGEEEEEREKEKGGKEEGGEEIKVIICSARAHFWNLQYSSETPVRLWENLL